MRRREFMLASIGASLVRPAGAQVSRVPRLAILSPTSRTGGHSSLVYEPFMAALIGLGWDIGRNIDVVERFADDEQERLPALARELVALQPDVIFTNTASGAFAAAEATRTIPVVVGPAGENVFVELAGNFARPTRNVTGMTLYSHGQDEKCLEMLKEAVPSLVRVGVLVNPLNPNLKDAPTSLRSAADGLGLTLIRMSARNADELDDAFSAASGIQGVHVPDDSNLAGRPKARAKILELTSPKRMPVTSTHLGFVRDGALLALGTDIPALAGRAAGYVDKILRGAKVAELPVERPTHVKLGINMNAARVLGVILPASLLARADEVIE